jgi:DNA polymerase
MECVVLDFETRSRVDVKEVGTWAYTEDPSTEILLLSLRLPEEVIRTWVGPVPEFRTLPGKLFSAEKVDFLSDHELKEILEKLVQDPSVHWIAHNVQFEWSLWKFKLGPYLGVPPPPLERWEDTALLASQANGPRDLSSAASHFQLSVGKDMIHRRSALRLAKPLKGRWVVKPETFYRAVDYNRKDVEVTWLLYQELEKWAGMERALKELDLKINARGFTIDLDYLDSLLASFSNMEAELAAEFTRITGIRHTQREKFHQWLWKEIQLIVPNLQEKTLEPLVRDFMVGLKPEEEVQMKRARRALQIYSRLAKASVRKLRKLRARVSSDGRLRGTLAAYGALTGRWAGRGFQPQNLPRPPWKKEEELEERVRVLLEEGAEAYERRYGEDPLVVVKAGLRRLVVSPPGKTLLSGDLRQIEARVLAWLAGDRHTLDVFASGKDVYVAAAARLFDLDEKMVSSRQRFLGKTATLALGYGGALNAFLRLAGKGEGLPSEEEILKIIGKWRKAHQEIVGFWKWAEKSARAALKKPGVPFPVGEHIKCWFSEPHRSFFVMLPSKRILRYPFFRWTMKEEEWVLAYEGRRENGSWGEVTTYGGKLVENWTQAVARDVLREDMLELDKRGFEIILHVHDEILVEEDENCAEERLKEMLACMRTSPAWAPGLPVDVEGWIGKRYRK